MIQLRFQGVLGLESEHKLCGETECYAVRLTTVSHCCTVLAFLSQDGLGTIKDIPSGLAMLIPTPNGTREVLPVQYRFFAMSHSVTHMLVTERKRTLLCISPQSFGQSIPDRPPCLTSLPSSLVSSEEVPRSKNADDNRIRLYICEEWGDCDMLREEIEQVGEEKFYYETSEIGSKGIKWAIYHEFVTDQACWCGQCAEQ